MAHADIQATMPSVKVLMARSVVVNLAYPARVLTEILGKVSLSLEDIEVFFRDQGEKEIKQIKQLIQQFFDNSSTIQEYASVNAVGFWQEIVGQLSLIQIEHPQCGVSTKIENPKQEVRPPKQEVRPSVVKSGSYVPPVKLGSYVTLYPAEAGPVIVKMDSLVALDPVEVDRRSGVCSIPLFDWTEEEFEVFHEARDMEHVQQILKAHDVFQYFFPPPDQLALGFVDIMHSSAGETLATVAKAPGLGHPFSQNELLGPNFQPSDLIEALQDRGFIVEGEFGLDLTAEGVARRANIKFKPREGLLSKIANIISVKIHLNLKDLFR